MQNLTIGLVLLGLALLVGVVLLLYQFGPDLGAPPAPEHVAAEAPDDEGNIVEITLGGDAERQQILEDARRRLSLEHTREMIEGQTRNLTTDERRSLDDRKRFEHVVRKGETLTSLARDYLGDEKLWRSILEANPALTRPEDLREGETIVIPTREAR